MSSGVTGGWGGTLSSGNFWRLIGKKKARNEEKKWKMQKKMMKNGKGKEENEEKWGKNEKVKEKNQKCNAEKD